ncbi:MAG TPA: Rieske 2Fe-2S domain-containing protein [Rubrobacter sp.]|jgi:nitrite reductase (NADH) small subunit|nr:Rieske 2Fe-2S domain-containing protein [Rubrobacter sp.]
MTEKRRTEHVVGDLSDFPEGEQRVVRVGRREIGVFNVGGALYGLPNVCPHQTGPLCEGRPPLGTLISRAENDWRFEWVHDSEIVACPWHGLEYHVPTGRCLAFPNVTLRSYEVVVEDDKVKIRL